MKKHAGERGLEGFRKREEAKMSRLVAEVRAGEANAAASEAEELGRWLLGGLIERAPEGQDAGQDRVGPQPYSI